jgi:predicted hydrocarbon binding protein
MTQRNIPLADHQLVAIGRPALLSLRAAVLASPAPDAAAALREAGYAGGEHLWSAFEEWAAAEGRSPEKLDMAGFQTAISDFFHALGWGAVDIGAHGDAVMTVESSDWWEAEPESDAAEPGCHFTTGLLAYFFGRVAEGALAVLEVQCRSAGGGSCRFLLGAPEVLRYLYDELEQGRSWEQAVSRVE